MHCAMRSTAQLTVERGRPRRERTVGTSSLARSVAHNPTGMCRQLDGPTLRSPVETIRMIIAADVQHRGNQPAAPDLPMATMLHGVGATADTAEATTAVIIGGTLGACGGRVQVASGGTMVVVIDDGRTRTPVTTDGEQSE
jgi:hypothetical protein